MAKDTLNFKQLEFCKHVSLGKTAAQAYQIAFPNAGSGTCAVNSSGLLKKPLIQAEIKRLQELNRDIVTQANKGSLSVVPEGEIIDRAKRMHILSQIATGALRIQKVFGSEIGPVSMEVEPDYSDRKSAIAELNKMDGQYAAEKVEHKINTLNVVYGKRKP